MTNIVQASGVQFIYPKSRMFPFDEVCELIVRALEARNWAVPGISVKFHEYDTGEPRYRMVDTIWSDEFSLWFCRIQGMLDNGLNDTGAITRLVIPEMELHVYEDNSEPLLYVYVGKDWEHDRKAFINEPKVNGKLHGKPRLFLRYDGSSKRPDQAGFQGYGGGRKAPYLVHNNNLERDYDLELGDPPYYRTDEIFSQFTKWLTENVLNNILAQAVPEKLAETFQPE